MDVNQKWYGLSAIHVAASKGHASIVQRLLDAGSDPNVNFPSSQLQHFTRIKSITAKKSFKLNFQLNRILRQADISLPNSLELSLTNHISNVLDTTTNLDPSNRLPSTRVLNTLFKPKLTDRSFDRFSEREREYSLDSVVFPIDLATSRGRTDIVRILLSR